MAGSGKCCHGRCRWDGFRQAEEEQQIAVEQIGDLKRKNKGLEDQLREAIIACEAGRRGTARRQDGGGKCLVLGDSVLRHVKTEHISVQCSPGIRTEQLKRVVENRDLGNPDTVLIHIGANDLKTNVILDFVMGDVYELVQTAKTVSKIDANTEWCT
jgi:lysophospholipase L1-like esterase